MITEQVFVPVERITGLILSLRGQRVILDADLARLYGVTTKRLNEQVKRNADRFPNDFMFTLNEDEKSELVANCDRFVRLKHSTTLPHAFTEHGALMAANVLNSPQAVEMSVFVVRAFIQQRAMLASHAELSLQLARMEKKLLAGLQVIHEHDDRIEAVEAQIDGLIDVLHALQMPDNSTKRPIGFRTCKDEELR